MAVTGTTAPATSGVETAATALPPLFAHLPALWAERFDPFAPWALLDAPLDEVLADLPSERLQGNVDPEAHLIGDGIFIGRGSRIAATAVIVGPVWIGEDVDIRPGAYLRDRVWIGDGCVVGAHTEVKGAILLPGAKAPHLNYVGDSILGAGVNLGAGTVLSNFRHDGREVRIPTPGGPLETLRRKFGAILGDEVLTGCNCVLNPGVVVGRGTQLYPGIQLLPGVYPEDSLIRLDLQPDVVPRRGR